ncbi:MAG: hypothetical protein PVI37_12100 [Gammaproteobacteria bacterium]|jgi:hypothetical protein
MNPSFLTYRKFLYLKLALLLVVAAATAYALDSPLSGRNGGTPLGYILGTIGALIILWLLWYGIRKRQFHSSDGTVKGWLSAHVYFGIALVIIATLHCAFQFGFNIHTLAYGLMVAVVLSGFYGIYAYARYPRAMTENRANMSPQAMLREVSELEQQCVQLADNIDDETRQVVLRSIANATIGGGWVSQLRGGTRRARKQERKADRFLHQRNQTLAMQADKLREEDPSQTLGAGATMRFMAGQLTHADATEKVERMRRLLDILSRRRTLVRRLNRDIRHRAWLQIWLYIHVPLSLALLGALAAHIVSVFVYW